MYWKPLLMTALLLLPLSLPVAAEDVEAEKESVRRAVETYLYAEEPEEKTPVIHPRARIYSVDRSRGKLTETPISAPAKKTPKGARAGRSRQKITDVEVSGEGALVRVETDLSPEGAEGRKHVQYLSLLKIGGLWKIVSILMPPPRLDGAGG